MNDSNKLITILGPTAVGKTKFAAHLAYHFSGEIISADSRQVYVGMDIGTGKDLEDYQIDNVKIRTHLVDVMKPNCEFNLFLFTQLFQKAFLQIIHNKKLPFLVGGTGLYLSSIVQNYNVNQVDFNSKRALELNELDEKKLTEILLKFNSELHNTTDTIEKKRIIKAILVAENSGNEIKKIKNMNNLIIGLYDDRSVIKNRIRKRLKERLKNGMIEEVEALLKNGVGHDKLRFFGLEYKFVSMYLKGELNYNDMQQKLASAIIQFSKRQMTWFRKMEKEGVKINWLKNSDSDYAKSLVKDFIK